MSELLPISLQFDAAVEAGEVGRAKVCRNVRLDVEGSSAAELNEQRSFFI